MLVAANLYEPECTVKSRQLAEVTAVRAKCRLQSHHRKDLSCLGHQRLFPSVSGLRLMLSPVCAAMLVPLLLNIALFAGLAYFAGGYFDDS